jgi:hypothetical protein
MDSRFVAASVLARLLLMLLLFPLARLFLVCPLFLVRLFLSGVTPVPGAATSGVATSF